MEWNNVQRVGFSVRNMDEVYRVVSLGANLIEIKVEKFANSGMPIYCSSRESKTLDFSPVTLVLAHEVLY